MKTSFSIKAPKSFSSYLFFLLLLGSPVLFAQVGIGTTSPNPDALLDVDATLSNGGILLPRLTLTSTASFAPLSAHVAGMLVHNTATINDVTPGFYYNDGVNWVSLSGGSVAAEPPIDSVTLTTDEIISGSTFTAVPGMSLTFTARKTEVLVNLTLSGLGYTGSLTFGSFRLYNSTTASVIGGTNTSAQSLWRDPPSVYSITTWSAAFSKKLTGLTIGTSYTIVLQGKTTNILGFDGVGISAFSIPDTSHATLSIIQ